MLDRELVLPHLLAKLARDDPDAIAMQDVDGTRIPAASCTRPNLRWADALPPARVEPGEHVVTMLPNSFVAFHAWLGLCWLGVTEVPTNTMYRGDMLRYLVTDSGAEHRSSSASGTSTRSPEVAGELSNLETVVVPDADRRAARRCRSGRAAATSSSPARSRPTTSKVPTTGTSPPSSTPRERPGPRRAC